MKVPSRKYIDNMSEEDRRRYAGHWIVVVNDMVVHHSRTEKNISKVVAVYDRCGSSPVVQYIPKAGVWLGTQVHGSRNAPAS